MENLLAKLMQIVLFLLSTMAVQQKIVLVVSRLPHLEVVFICNDFPHVVGPYVGIVDKMSMKFCNILGLLLISFCVGLQ